MLDQILSSVKGELAPQLEKMGLPEGKSEETLGIAKNDILGVFQKEVTGGNMSGILNLFNGKQGISSSPIVSSIVSKFGGSLIAKLGLDPSIASKVSDFVIPFIMSKMDNDTPSEGISSSDLTKMIGGGVVDSITDGLKGKLGGLFN